MKELLDGGVPVWVVGTIRVVGSKHRMHHEGTLGRRCTCVGSRHHTCSGMACIMKDLLDGGVPVWVVGTIRVVAWHAS